MAIIKCKMCGGDLNIVEGMSVAECEYCGTKQTVPNVDSEKKLTLFSRANRLRLACEFDKAASVYESIVAEFSEEAEAYWGLVLCRYGIEYVDDPATGKKVPTCHRSSFESILEDSDFEQACENADAVARKVYREEAKAIEEIRKGILEVSGKEPPYDIFICYKETDEAGNRTIDSVLAQDVYDVLMEKDYRVFFSRITLEEKLGTEYEPYIFAALNSAKVMLAFGTDYEYFNAVWVKNEWSRFLKLMAHDKSKHLIPCYKNVDAYDLPKEFQKLQAQDLGKVGAIQDLLRGLDKLLNTGSSRNTIKETIVVQQTIGPSVESLLKRGQLFLNDSDWKSASETFNKVLDINPECADAYIGKLCAQKRYSSEDMLRNEETPLEDNSNFQKAIQFGSPEIIERLERYNQEIYDRLESSLKIVSRLVACGDEYTIGVQADGSVLAAGSNMFDQCKINNWSNITKVVCGQNYTVGLQTDGTVKTTAKDKDIHCDRRNWINIIDISCSSMGAKNIVGICADGTVVATGNNKYGQCNVCDWSDITQVVCGLDCIIGVRANGTVVATGSNKYGECNVNGWTDILYVTCGWYLTVGIRTDGTVVAAGNNKYNQCDVSEWSDIVTIACGFDHIVGLRTDGTVVATGNNKSGQCNVEDWRNVVSVHCGVDRTVGLCADGTVVATGKNTHGQCNVSEWSDIVTIACGFHHTIGLRADGTVMTAGSNTYGQCNVNKWRLFQSLGSLSQKQLEIAQHLHMKKELSGDTESREIIEYLTALTEERRILQDELSHLKGLFTGMRRKQIETRLEQINEELERL